MRLRYKKGKKAEAVIARIESGQVPTTGDWKALGLPFDLWLWLAKLSEERRAKALAALVREWRAQTQT